ncbi:MAG: two-component regulator propeller domain-containing protein [Bacteroides cellulosilyticus]
MLRKAPFFSYVVRMVTFFGFLGLSLYMNARNIQIKDIPHIDKLSTNVINTIFQDSEGYIWYGTAEDYVVMMVIISIHSGLTLKIRI